MKKDPNPPTSQDHRHKHGQDRIFNNLQVEKRISGREDGGTTGISQETAALIAKGHTITNKPSSKSAYVPDVRNDVRHADTNHFTNREGHGEKK